MIPRVAPRDDLRALEGYHSPQLDVAVRLNRNESPFPPPDAFVDRWLAELRTAPLNRYPDRDAQALRAALGSHIGQPAERLFCANGSNEVNIYVATASGITMYGNSTIYANVYAYNHDANGVGAGVGGERCRRARERSCKRQGD